MKPTRLGPLAYAILEEHGDVVRAAVDDVVTRTRAEVAPDVQRNINGRVYDAEAAHQPLLEGNWVPLGEVAATTTVIHIDVNVSAGKIRERQVAMPSRSRVNGCGADAKARRLAQSTLPSKDEEDCNDQTTC